MSASPVTIQAPALEQFCHQILRAAGVRPDWAKLVAESLVAANLRGVDSHGVQLLHWYVEQIVSGDLDPAMPGEVVSASGCCLSVDGQNGLGQVISALCCERGIATAKELGMSLVVARESNHFGAAAFWAQRYADAGLIGIVMCNASPQVPPWQAREPRVGTNPVCMAVPDGGEKTWLLDMATTTVAAGKIYKAGINGQEEIPAGWAMDAEGVPTTSTQTALKGLLMPLGGYKGSGLAMMVEILCAVLGGGGMSTDLGGIRIRGRRMRASQSFLGIDVRRFLPPGEFTARMRRLVDLVHGAPPAKGYSEVLVAGEPEWRIEAQRLERGIPIEAGNWELLCGAGRRFGIEPPAVASTR